LLHNPISFIYFVLIYQIKYVIFLTVAEILLGVSMKTFLFGFIILSGVFLETSPAYAEIVVDQSFLVFYSQVETELGLIRDGKRGIACQELIRRLDASPVTTTIAPITEDERTWHPNDRKGTRSHVVPQDTKLRGGARNIPTPAILYLHPTRIDPSLSLYKLGTFVHELANAADLNRGEFSGDYKTAEKRASFFRNAWRDSFGWSLMTMSGQVPIPEYQNAKKGGMISLDFASYFPILDIAAVQKDMARNQLESTSIASPTFSLDPLTEPSP